MIRKSVTVTSNNGLGVRPIALLVQQASQYVSQVFIEVGSKRINAKSIIGVMSLQLVEGEGMVLMVDGEDEEAALKEIEAFFTP